MSVGVPAAHLLPMTDPHLMAWDGLGDRLAGGLQTLSNLLAEASTEQKMRLRRKAAGVRRASDLYRELDTAAATRIDNGPARAWATFTRLVFNEWQAADHAPETTPRDADRNRAAYASGLALALEYQRGYAPGIDAPSLDVLRASAHQQAEKANT